MLSIVCLVALSTSGMPNVTSSTTYPCLAKRSLRSLSTSLSNVGALPVSTSKIECFTYWSRSVFCVCVRNQPSSIVSPVTLPNLE